MQRMQKIELPKEIAETISAIETKGYEAYVAAGAVRDLLLERKPLDGEVITNAPPEELLVIFPNDEVINVIFVDDIKEDLNHRDFTMDAIAYSPRTGFVDPFDGIHDIQSKLIRMIGDPLARLPNDPIKMMRVMRLTAETGFDIHMQIYKVIYEKSELLKKVSTDEIRLEFEKLVVADFAGKGIKMLDGTGVIKYVLGDLAKKKSGFRKFEMLTERMGKSDNSKSIRLGLFYTCYDEESASSAIERMNFDSETNEKLKDAITKMDAVNAVSNKLELKQLIACLGMDRYKYLHELSRAQQVVYNLHDSKVTERQAMIKELEADGEPIFLEK